MEVNKPLYFLVPIELTIYSNRIRFEGKWHEKISAYCLGPINVPFPFKYSYLVPGQFVGLDLMEIEEAQAKRIEKYFTKQNSFLYE